MFTFPQQTNSAQVRLVLSGLDLSALTVCLRYFTDLGRDYSLFSLATPSADNALLIYKEAASDRINLAIRNSGAVFRGQDYRLNTWHSVCATWDSASGVGQMWLDGKPSSRKFISSGSDISGPIIIVLGQEQDSHGGGFDINQSFVGMLSDIHMWDHTLLPCQIQNYEDYLTFTAGNLLNWRTLEFLTKGRVLIEDKHEPYC
nr:serum amyloid P-component-like isoform X2 [Epinephelus lanceolatus]XP_033496049.1 serum amyloid P-component-like isoform X2 [Epinephelus lanceolatus]